MSRKLHPFFWQANMELDGGQLFWKDILVRFGVGGDWAADCPGLFPKVGPGPLRSLAESLPNPFCLP